MRNKVFVASFVIAVAAAASLLALSAPAQAALSTNASADVVVGQADKTSSSPNKGVSLLATDASQLFLPRAPFFDGSKFFVVDQNNHRVLIYNSIPTADNASADIVIGQPNMTSNLQNQGAAAAAANTLNSPSGVFSNGSKLFIADSGNNRVLVYNSIPTADNASADIVIGQPNMTSVDINQGTSVAANTLYGPTSLFFDGKKLFISDWENNRVLIFNSLPSANNANADAVIGQQNLTSNAANQGGSVSATALDHPNGIWGNGKQFFIADQYNQRVLIYNSIPTSNNASADVVVGQADKTSNGENQGGSVAANTMLFPTHVLSYGPKILVLDAANSRLLVYNSIPTSNNANADVAIGQPNLTSGDIDQGGDVSANTLDFPRGFFVANSKLMIGGYYANRVLIYNNFGAQWAIAKNKSQVLTGGEKIKVKKSKLEFSGKKKEYKKGKVRIVVDGVSKKIVKIKNSGKWSAKFDSKGNAVRNIIIRYYDSHKNLQLNSETYVLGIRTGNSALMFEKATFKDSFIVRSDKKTKKTSKNEDLKMPKEDIRGK